MKKLLLFAVSAAFAGLVNAQDCTSLIDNSAMELGLHPYPPVGSFAGIPYDEVNTLVLPKMVPFGSDSLELCRIQINSVTGLPSGYSYEVWAFQADQTSYNVTALTTDTIPLLTSPTRGCIRLKNPNPPAPTDMTDGLPSRDTARIDIIVMAYADLFQTGSCDPLGALGTDTFQVGLAIHTANSVSIEDEMGFGFEVGNNYPNPAQNVSYLNFTTPVAGEVTVTLTDAVGRNVYNYTGTSVQGKNVFGIPTEEFTNGVYIYNVTYKGKTISKKMIVSK